MCWLLQMRSGFPANSVFIVDSEDRVRHHTVLDPRFKDFYEGLWEVELDDVGGDGGDVDQPQGGLEHGGGGKAGGCLQVSFYLNLSLL